MPYLIDDSNLRENIAAGIASYVGKRDPWEGRVVMETYYSYAQSNHNDTVCC